MEEEEKTVLDAEGRGTLLVGVKVVDSLLKDFQMREPTAGDYFDAEEISPPDRRITYQMALASRCLVRFGDLKGPIPFDVMRRLTPKDMHILSAAIDELTTAGK